MYSRCCDTAIRTTEPDVDGERGLKPGTESGAFHLQGVYHSMHMLQLEKSPARH